MSSSMGTKITWRPEGESSPLKSDFLDNNQNGKVDDEDGVVFTSTNKTKVKMSSGKEVEVLETNTETVLAKDFRTSDRFKKYGSPEQRLKLLQGKLAQSQGKKEEKAVERATALENQKKTACIEGYEQSFPVKQQNWKETFSESAKVIQKNWTQLLSQLTKAKNK